MRFAAAQADDRSIQRYLRLFQVCFPAARHYRFDFLKWMYHDNPEGEVFGTDAIVDDETIAHFVGLPSRVVLSGQERRSLLILNVATHPTHQRKGLFAELATQTRAAALAQGFDVLFGVANAQTIPGYRGKLGYQDVGGLDARLGFGRVPIVDWPAAQAQSRFFRAWTAESLQWRLRNPANPVSARQLPGGITAFDAATAYPGIRAYAERDGDPTVAAPDLAHPAAHVFVGAVPKGASRPGLSLPIPDRLRPSPLRLIFLDLHQPERRLSMDDVLFSFLDFDAF
jgi:GNAT superfamily N-acetyltransferase